VPPLKYKKIFYAPHTALIIIGGDTWDVFWYVISENVHILYLFPIKFDV
jgi:hypothetical protein